MFPVLNLYPKPKRGLGSRIGAETSLGGRNIGGRDVGLGGEGENKSSGVHGLYERMKRLTESLAAQYSELLLSETRML